MTSNPARLPRLPVSPKRHRIGGSPSILDSFYLTQNQALCGGQSNTTPPTVAGVLIAKVGSLQGAQVLENKAPGHSLIAKEHGSAPQASRAKSGMMEQEEFTMLVAQTILSVRFYGAPVPLKGRD